MLIADIRKFKATGKHVLPESINPDTGKPIEIETFFDEANKKSYEIDPERHRYRESNVVGEYGEWKREKKEGLF